MISAKHLMKKSMLCISTMPKRNSAISFYITLPEMPENHVPNIGLMPVPNKFPKFRNIDALGTFFDLGKASIEFEDEMSSIINKIEESGNNMEFDEVMQEMDKSKVYLYSVLGLLNVLNLVNQPDFTEVMRKKLNFRINKALMYSLKSESFYAYLKHLQSKGQLAPNEKNLMDLYIMIAELEGINLSEPKLAEFTKQLSRMENYSRNYLLNLDIQNTAYSQEITDKKVMEEFPSVFKSLMCSYDSDPNEGPWSFNMDSLLVNNFFKYCSNATLRSMCWTAVMSRATSFTNPRYRNSSNVEDIRGFRYLMAKMLGESCYSKIAMKRKMAVNADVVLDVLRSISINVRPAYEEELDSLIELANTKGQIKEFEPCDIEYWRRHQLQEIIGLSNTEILSYFPLEHVWTEALSWCSQMFDVSIKPAEIIDKSHLWHNSVRMYEIVENGSSLGFFYFDPVMRASKKFTTYDHIHFVKIRPGSKIGSVPLTAIIGGISNVNDKGEYLVSMANMKELFSVLGTLMQEMLPTNYYCDMYGLMSIEADAKNITKYFFSNWLRNPQFLKRLSKNCLTNEPISDAVAKKLAASQSHLAAHDMTQEMMLAHIDQLLCTTKTFWPEIIRNVWKHYQPLPYNNMNQFLCSYPSLVIGSDIGCYYADFWSQIVGADVYTAFKECAEEDMPTLGKKYRETFLQMGSDRNAVESFQEFRGRELDYNAITLLNNIPSQN